jgi:hypothetical protein
MDHDRFTDVFGTRRGPIAPEPALVSSPPVNPPPGRTSSGLPFDELVRQASAAVDVIVAIQECARDLGRAPTQKAYEQWRRHVVHQGSGPPTPNVSVSTVVRAFGSWSAARAAAGV